MPRRSRRKGYKLLYLYVISGIVGGVVLIFAFVWWNNRALKTTRYNIDAGLKSGVKIVHLSDLHGARFGRDNSRLLLKVAAEKPDFIAFTGDAIHKYRPRDIETALKTASALCAIAPVLYVSGNHEMRNKGYRFFRLKLMEAGVRVLDDCTADICGLSVTGLNCASLKNDKINSVTPPEKDGEPRLLLAHMPHFAEKYAAAGYDVVLCGHAHGGQWRIPFTGAGIFAPGQGLFPKLTSGVHVYGKTRVVISRGLGNSQCPLRLFNRPEIVVVELS